MFHSFPCLCLQAWCTRQLATGRGAAAGLPTSATSTLQAAASYTLLAVSAHLSLASSSGRETAGTIQVDLKLHAFACFCPMVIGRIHAT